MAAQYQLTELISLKNKTAIITGAASGIGLATAHRFAEAGAELHLVDVNREKLRAVQSKLAIYNVPINAYRVDLKSKSEIDGFWNTFKHEWPHILVNNAGIYPFRDFLDTDEDLVHHVMNVNLHAVYWMCQHLVRGCLARKQQGTIVNLASIEALLPFKSDLAHYTTTKAAVIALTRALARDYGGKRIRANVVLPGGVLTEGTRDAAKQVLQQPGLILDGIKFRSRLPLQRFGHPDEVARMILVLASDMAAYMTGAVVSVDGGFLSA